MENNDSPEMGNRVWGLLGVALVFVVIIVVAQSNADTPVATSTTLDFTSGTSVTLTTTTDTTEPQPTPPTTVSADGPGWSVLPANDLPSRSGFAAVYAGDRLVVWGGVRPESENLRDGASFANGIWTDMADSPIVAGTDPVTVWTGSELFAYSGPAAAWNPSTNTWRRLGAPAASFNWRAQPLTGVWTGSEVILVRYRFPPPTREANLSVTSYGADLQCCRSLPEPPFSLTFGEAFWTGDEMLLIGGLLEPDSAPRIGYGQPYFGSFDPVSGTWTVYDPPPFDNFISLTTTWNGDSLFAVTSSGAAARWNPAEGWVPLPQVPLPGLGCTWRLASVGSQVVALNCFRAAVWDDTAQRWFATAQENLGFHSDVCELVPEPGESLGVYLVCSSDLLGNQLSRIDLSAVEAGRYSNLSTLSQWELLPNPAATRLDSTAMVWSGNELLYFSGQGIETEAYRGWGYDPGTNTMHRIPDSPFAGRSGQVALWTGEEMLVWRGSTTLWDPIRLQWRTAEQSPALGGAPFAVWTGEEAIFYGSRNEPSNAGAIYDPATDTWRGMKIAPSAVAVGQQVAAWSGDEMYVLGNWSGFTQGQSGGVYDPMLDSWRPLPPIPEEFAMSGSVGDFVGGEFIVLGENWDPHPTENAPLIAGLAFSPESNAWRTIAPVRTPDVLAQRFGGLFRTQMAAVRHGDELAVFLPAGYSTETPTIAFYNPATDTWRYADGAPANAWGPPMVSADTFVAYLSPSGTVLLHDG